jgi:RNA polymerase sigma factor (sigma-70 family)
LSLQEEDKIGNFEQTVMPHLDAAYNLARWLTRNEHDAEDAVQEAYLRSFRSFGGFHGTDGRGWLLTIVRNTCYTWLRRNRSEQLSTPFDEEIHREEVTSPNPEELLLQTADRQRLQDALEELPVEFREALVLREIEGLSYKEIANVSGVPVGTVMSRLARARERLKEKISHLQRGPVLKDVK